MSCGQNGWTDWDRAVIDGLVDLVDLHSVHIYSGSRRLLDQRAQPAPSRASHHFTSTLIAARRL